MFGNFHASCFPASAGVNLGFDHRHVRADLFSRFDSLLNGKSDFSVRHNNAVLLQHFFCLIFVNVHGKAVASRIRGM